MQQNGGQSREARLQEFVDWCAAHITGDEKGQAQIFLDHLFRGFGQKGTLDVGGTPEMRVRKASEDGGGTSFADYVWKPVVLIEMKKRGADLSKHYRQAFDYWIRLVPDRPQYVILCNFDEFWVYDFNNQLDSPKDKVNLTELSTRWGPLAFLFPTNEPPKFGNDREKVTREAADRLALCFRKLITRKVDRNLAQRFILQTLVALFAEDIGLLPRYLLATLLDDCKEPADSYDLLGGLFEAMNTDRLHTGGKYKGVRYFNGGIFAEPARIELYEDEINQLKGASQSDWSKVSPEIFGAIFQESMDADERHAFGAHYTSPVDIMKIVKPTISDPWSEAIKAARSEKRLNELLARLSRLRVLDPACGSGNFLYLAYRDMKRMETRIRERLATDFPGSQPVLDHVNARQFFGLDINSFAIELAKVSMMIGRKLAIDELHIADERDLPLDNLDTNFLATDALMTMTRGGTGAGAIQTPWPPADVIIGNPPFLGAKLLKPERGPDYVNALRKLYKVVPGMADYCVYWIRRTHDHLPECTKADPLVGRAGLVGTQNIRNNQSRVGGLDYVVATGTIIEAVDNQPWSGEANVHVSIANWMKTHDATLIPATRRLWFKVPPARGTSRNGGGNAAKQYELDVRRVQNIGPSLSDATDITQAKVLSCNEEPHRSFNGQMLGHERFLLTADQRLAIVKRDPRSAAVMFPYLNGREFLSGDGRPDRYVLDFGQRNQMEATAYPGAFQWVRANVLPDREKKASEGVDADGKMRSHHKGFLARWWQLSFGRQELVSLIAELPRYIVCSLVTKRAIFEFVDSSIRPSNLLQVFTFADDYTFGVLQSRVHWTWFVQQSSKLKSDYRFGENIWHTFPWPQSPTSKQINAVASAAVAVRRVRAEAVKLTTGGLRAVYRTLELPGKHPLKDAHTALDAAVLAAYGFDARKDLLAQLLQLNLTVAAMEKQGKPVTAPGVPPGYGDPAKLITDDCIKP
ncbi:MAG TPA: DNA methyltransferase [Tepidisphaeraceae bacterium]|jgi:SAM-dependent methyltransferase|nr:DNA methyltransferase [Tepidisphaeraceae bacterium]